MSRRRPGPARPLICRLQLCTEEAVKTDVSIDARLLERALDVSGEPTKEAVVRRALEQFVEGRLEQGFAALFGTLDPDTVHDARAERSRS